MPNYSSLSLTIYYSYRLFSSGRTTKTTKFNQRNRVQTAKLINNSNMKWKGGSQVFSNERKKKYKGGVKLSRKHKSKYKPLTKYNWPNENSHNLNKQRPITAGYGGGRDNRRSITNYRPLRNNKGSKGKDIPMGLTGTSKDQQSKPMVQGLSKYMYRRI